MGEINAIIIDPDPIRRKRFMVGLKSRKGISVICVGSNISRIYEENWQSRQPDLVIINLDLPEMLNPHTWASLHFLFPRTRIVGLTETAKSETIRMAMCARVDGLHPANLDLKDLVKFAERDVPGGLWCDIDLSRKINRLFGKQHVDSPTSVGNLTIVRSRGEVYRSGVPIRLTDLEFRVLSYFFNSPGRSVSAQELLEFVWETPLNEGGTLDQVWSCIKRLRKKIEPDEAGDCYLKTARDEGYIFGAFSTRLTEYA